MKYNIIAMLALSIFPTIMYGASSDVLPKNLDMKINSYYVADDTRIIQIHYEISTMKDWQGDPIKELKSPKIENRIQAAFRLGGQKTLSEAGIKSLLNSINDKSHIVRTNILWALGKSGATSEMVLEGIINVLNDNNENVRINAIAALYNFGGKGKKAIPQLKSLIKHDKDEVVKEVAQVVLGHINEDKN